MGLKRVSLTSILAILAAASLAGPATADEGLWTYDAFPAAAVRRSLGVSLDRPWLDRLRAGSVRLTTGCSGALVSPAGLVATNQHCVLNCVQTLSDPLHDHMRDGFGILSAEPPRPCPGVQAEILAAIVDITEPVFRVSQGRFGDDFVRARETLLAKAERTVCRGDRRYRCQVISFFGGGQFKVYKYRRYDDVRLVFAPEFPVAFFGGDAENFTFPRYDLDVAMLRLYEHGAPARTQGALNWSARAPTAGEATFVSGSPGATERALTAAQLETLRDLTTPDLEAQDALLADRLDAFGRAAADHERRVGDRLFEVRNALKVLRGQADALADPAFMAARRADDAALEAGLAGQPRLAAAVGDPWAEIAALQKTFAARYPSWRRLESGAGAGSRLFWYARTLTRAADERIKPPAERLPEYADARLALLTKTLLDDQPIDPEVERIDLQTWLEEVCATFGPGDPAAATVMDGETPAVLAQRLVSGSRLADPAYRAALWRDGRVAIQASADPLIAFVRRTDGLSRAAREQWETSVVGPTDAAAERIARVRFALRGDTVYPDATFSPRISFGRVEGWRDALGAVTPFTTLGGLYDHASDRDPRRLPARWLAARDGIDRSLTLNFVTTNDIVGGNSGSPVVDAAGRMIGLAFDGNQRSFAGAFAYDGAVNRTVVVSTAAISAALGKVYGRPDLATELQDPFASEQR